MQGPVWPQRWESAAPPRSLRGPQEAGGGLEPIYKALGETEQCTAVHRDGRQLVFASLSSLSLLLSLLFSYLFFFPHFFFSAPPSIKLVEPLIMLKINKNLSQSAQYLTLAHVLVSLCLQSRAWRPLGKALYISDSLK